MNAVAAAVCVCVCEYIYLCMVVFFLFSQLEMAWKQDGVKSLFSFPHR